MVRPPAWITDFANSIALSMFPVDVMAPLGCHYYFSEGTWEITLFPSQTEIIGGVHDGEKKTSPFCLDVKLLIDRFSKVDAIEWQSQPASESDEIGSNIAIVGIYDGHDVILRVCQQAPERFHPGRYANVYEKRWVETW